MSNLTVGHRVAAIDEAWTDAATAADLTELQTVLDAVHLDTPPRHHRRSPRAAKPT